MGSLKPRYPVVYLKFNGSGQDDYGNDIESWAEGVDKMVYGVRFPVTTEPMEAGHNRLVVDCVLLIPNSFSGVDERDRFKLPRLPGRDPDQLYEVIGLAETADGNPFGWHPGGRLSLRRING